MIIHVLLLLNVFSRTAENHDDPLILTDYINIGQIDKARNLSRVTPFAGDIESHAGYFRVSKECERNMFFWFFRAESKNASAPLLVWLQGGPGASSLYGLFTENGPYYVDSELDVRLREVRWTRNYNVIYIDNPVGTGFSFSKEECYLTTEGQVGYHLLQFMVQFLTVFHELDQNPFYITGESYAGKYVPAMAYAIHQSNQMSSKRINLVGMAIGDGFTDPRNMLDYGGLLFSWGLISQEESTRFDSMYEEIVRRIDRGEFREGFHLMDTMIDGDITPYPTLFENTTGLTNYFNLYDDKSESDYFPQFLEKIRDKIHVGDIPYGNGNKVELALIEDILKSMAPVVEKLLDAGYKCLFYNGQLDIIVPYASTSAFIAKMRWSGGNEFANASRTIWRGRDRVYGYVKSAKNLVQTMVRDSGHMVPSDQPEAALEMIDIFVNDGPFSAV